MRFEMSEWKYIVHWTGGHELPLKRYEMEGGGTTTDVSWRGFNLYAI